VLDDEPLVSLEQRAGALDGALLDLFIDARIFERTDRR